MIKIFTFIISQEVFLLLSVICLFFSCLLHSPVRFSLRWVIVSQSNSFFYRYPVFKRQVISFHSGFSNGNFMQFNFKPILTIKKNCGKFRKNSEMKFEMHHFLASIGLRSKFLTKIPKNFFRKVMIGIKVLLQRRSRLKKSCR